MNISASTKIVIALDMAGWEQDGKGPRFVCPATGERKKFKNWTEACDFALEVHGKKSRRTEHAEETVQQN